MSGFDVRRKIELGYGCTHFGKTLLWTVGEALTLYYLTEVLSVAHQVAGSLFLGLLLWGAGCDLLFGRLVDRYVRTQRAVRAVFLCFVPLTAAAFALSFMDPFEMGTWWVALASIVFRTTFSVVDVPHNALIARLAAEGADSTSLGTMRLASGALATLSVALGTVPLLEEWGGMSQTDRFALFASALGALAALLFLIFLPPLGAWERREIPQRRDPATPVLLAILSTPAVLLVFGATAIGTILSGMLLKSLAYVAKYDLSDPGWMGKALCILTLGKLLSAPLWAWIARRTSLITALQLAYALTAIVAFALFAASADRQLLEIGIAALGFTLGGTSMLPWALLPELSTAVASRSGCHSESTLCGVFTASTKIAIGISGWTLGAVLAISVADHTTHIGSDVPSSLFHMVCVTVAAGMLASLLMLRGLNARMIT